MTNRLANAKSTYLLQHKDNPVDWWEWGAAAFEEARRRDVPVLLSVGYASCHWCHVMAHESFEDPATAAAINRDFVAIKVDREERPGVDATYMAATQALTGQGGWPMTCFLDHAGRPFYAGTYFPREPRAGMPAFTQVLGAVARAWREDRGGVDGASTRIADHLRAGSAATGAAEGGGPATTADLDAACRDLLASLDAVHGGFGGAPKFPPAMALGFLLRHHERTGNAAALEAATLTLERMARGGIYDQLGGGFARYSVDNAWHTPHFEKMLNDNALLLRVYAHHARLAASPLSQRIARETADFMIREMRSPTGGFITSLDADAGGVEGGTYRWPLDELTSVVRRVVGGVVGGGGDGSGGSNGGDEDDGAADAAVAEVLTMFGVDRAHPDPEGEILRLVRDPADPAAFEKVRGALIEVRRRRPQPGRDEMVVLRGNALAITALAEAGAVADRPEWIAAAGAAADAVMRLCRTDTGWRHSGFGGVPGAAPAMLGDLAGLAAAVLALYQATGDTRWLDAAGQILDGIPAAFGGPGGAWFDVPDIAARHGVSDPHAAAGVPAADGPAIVRSSDPTDGAAPSGLAAAADAFVTAAALTGTDRWRAAGEQIATLAAPLATRFPRSAGWHLAVAEALAAGPLQVAIAGPAGPRRTELARAARRATPGGGVIDIGDADEPGHPLLADRPGIGGQAAGYVCRGFVCDAPTESPADLERALRRMFVIGASARR